MKKASPEKDPKNKQNNYLNNDNEIKVNIEKTALLLQPSSSSPASNKIIDSDELSSDHEIAVLDENIEEKLSKVDDHVEVFFNKICTQTYRDMAKEKIVVDHKQSIQYGNLIDSYDPNNSIHTKTNTYLEVDTSSPDEPATTTNAADASRTLELLKILNKNSKANIRNLKMIHKSSLITLIERNRLNGIYCPFDELAYLRLQAGNECDSGSIEFPEISNISSLRLNAYDIAQISDFSLMPNCVSSFSMPFFFDIFKPSELKHFTRNTIDIMTKLKTLYTPQLNLNELSIVSFGVENLIWNCFALFKYKFSAHFRHGFLNYLISTACLLEYFRTTNEKLYFKLNQMLPYFIEALILNGFLNSNDLKEIRLAFEDAKRQQPLIDISYFDASLSRLKQAIQVHEPMKLKYRCRIFIKQTIKNFNYIAIQSLKINDDDKRFLLFQEEFAQYYRKNSNLL